MNVSKQPLDDTEAQGAGRGHVPGVPMRASRWQSLWSTVNERPAWTLAALVAFYLAIACGQAATKLLWGDELITLAISRQGGFAGIWRALALGTDPNPPLMHWMVLWSTRLLGSSALAVRLPAIACVLLAILSLWTILRRWVLPGYAAAGVLAFMATRGFDYAYDARSYAPLMGFAMAGLALWLASTDKAGGARIALLGGMAAALALGISSNYYGVLAFFPIAAGELARQTRLRNLHPGAWVAMALASLPLLAYLPLIHHNIAEFSPHAWNRPHPGMITESYFVLVEGVFWPVLGLAVFAVWKRRSAVRFQEGGRGMQSFEIVSLAVLLAYPVLGFAIAVAGAGMISPRCVVPVCCGFGIALAVLCARVFGGSARAGVVVLCVAMVWVVARESACAVVLRQQRNAFLSLRDRFEALPAGQSIVLADSLFALPLAHYASESVRSRLVFPIDFEAIHRYQADDSGEQNLWAGRNGVFPIRIVAYDGSLFPASGFSVVSGRDGWLPRRLLVDGFGAGDIRVDDPAWQELGGVFTPLAHGETQLFRMDRPFIAP